MSDKNNNNLEDKMVSVRFGDLHQLLKAALGEPHLIREDIVVANTRAKLNQDHYLLRLTAQVNGEIGDG